MRNVICGLMIIIGLIGIYSLFNLGNQNSLVRPIIPNPNTDIYLVIVSSFLFFVLGFFVFYSRDRADFRKIVELNKQKIQKLRAQGKTEIQIADSILHAMGSYKGYKHNLSLKKLVITLTEFKR